MLREPYLLRDRTVIGTRRTIGGTGPRRITSHQHQNVVRAAHHGHHHARLVHIELSGPVVRVSRLLIAPVALLLVALHPLQRYFRLLVQIVFNLGFAPSFLAQAMRNQGADHHHCVTTVNDIVIEIGHGVGEYPERKLHTPGTGRVITAWGIGSVDRHTAILWGEAELGMHLGPGTIHIHTDTVGVLGRRPQGRFVANIRVPSANIHEHQTHRSPDGGVGPAAVTEQANAMINPHLLHHRPADNYQRRCWIAGRLQALDVEPLVQQRLHCGNDNRHVLGAATGHDGVGRDGFNRGDTLAWRHNPQDFHGIPARSSDHAVNKFRGWRYDRQAISPAIRKILFDDIDGAPHRVQSGELRRRFSGHHVSFPLPLAFSPGPAVHTARRAPQRLLACSWQDSAAGSCPADNSEACVTALTMSAAAWTALAPATTWFPSGWGTTTNGKPSRFIDCLMEVASRTKFVVATTTAGLPVSSK